MMFILNELWNNGLDPSTRRIRKDSRYEELFRQANEDEDKFCEELSPTGKKAYDAYCDAQDQLSEISEQDCFIQGFRMGAKIILDVVGEYDSQLPEVEDR